VGPPFHRAEETPPHLDRERAAGNSSARSASASTGSELKRVVDAAAERVDEIVDGAEGVASQIIAEAEMEATRYADERRAEVERAIDQWSADLRGLAELLSRQEGRLRELTEAMMGELEEIAAALGRIPPEIDRSREIAPSPPAKDSPQARGGTRFASPRTVPTESRMPTAAEPGAESSPSAPDPGEAPPASRGRENALLRAAQMAVGGSSREEIESALRTELAVSDPGPIVDELLGPRG
jgi:hypothetical protein